MQEELTRSHSQQDATSLNRWLIVLLCALVRHNGDSAIALTKQELDDIDKGWALDYCYNDDTREVRLAVRPGPYTETYVVGSRMTGWAREDNPELDRLREPSRNAAPNDSDLANMERQAHAERVAREAEAAGWQQNRRLRPNP